MRAMVAPDFACRQAQIMFLLKLLFVLIVHLTMIGLDVLSFFVVIRMLTFRWPKPPLLALDHVGRPAMDPLLASIDRAIPSGWATSLERRKHLAAVAALLALALGQLGLARLFST